MGRLRAPYPIEIFDEVSSTNDTILSLGAEGAPEGTTHLARRQTRGRGRGSNSWWSPENAGLWMSVLLRPDCPRESWSGLSLIGGTAVRTALRGIGAADVQLYWPNDLYVGRRKLGGILAEVRGSGEDAWVALGIGINVDLRPSKARGEEPAGLEGRAICLAEAGVFPDSDPDPNAFTLNLCERILESLAELYEGFQEGIPLGNLIDESLAHRGRRVEIRQTASPTLHGTVVGLGERGELLVEDNDGAIHPIIAAEVLYER